MTFEYGPFIKPELIYSADQISGSAEVSKKPAKLGKIGPVYEVEVPFPHDRSVNFLHFAVGGFEDPAETGKSRYDQLIEEIGDGEEMLMRRMRPKEIRRLKNQKTKPLTPGSTLAAIDLR